MTNPTSESGINVPLLLREHLPVAIRNTKARIAKLEASLLAERGDLETLIRHAAVANIPVEIDDAPATSPAPVLNDG